MDFGAALQDDAAVPVPQLSDRRAEHAGARVPWLASQTDILAEDWSIVA